MFSTEDRPPEQARVLSLTEAAALGYHISHRGSHLVFRCPYSSPLSQSVKVHADDVVYSRLLVLHHSVIKWMLCVGVNAFSQERGVDLEIVRATILYRLRSNFLAADTTVACAQS